MDPHHQTIAQIEELTELMRVYNLEKQRFESQ